MAALPIASPLRSCSTPGYRKTVSPILPARSLLRTRLFVANVTSAELAIQDNTTKQRAKDESAHAELTAAVDLLDKTRPTAHVLLDTQLAVWFNSAEKQWACFEDACPHRQAALSEGRVVGDSLVCSHHGWTFNLDGSCKHIPQLDPSSQSGPCANKRSCAQAYPTRVDNGLLYVWMDVSPEGLAKSKTSSVANTGQEPTSWVVMHFPNDYQAILEQTVDPSHAPILHHGLDGNTMSNVIPFEANGTSPKVDLKTGFTMTHGGYEKRNQGMKATRKFNPPYHVIVEHAKPTSTVEAHILVVPERPGRCLTVSCARFLPPKPQTQHSSGITPTDTTAATATSATSATAQLPSNAAGNGTNQGAVDNSDGNGSSKPAPNKGSSASMPWVFGVMMAVMRVLPHWVTQSFAVFDQDIVMAHSIESRVMSRKDLSSKKTYLPAASGADAGVIAMRRWCEAAGYPESLFGRTFSVVPQTLDELLDRKRMHVDDCIVCQKGLKFMTRVCQVVSAATQLAITFTAALAANALVHQGSVLSAWKPLLLSAFVSVVLWRLSRGLWDMHEERFVTGSKAWARRGGLSLVTPSGKK